MVKATAQTLATGAVETLMAQPHAPVTNPAYPDPRPAERLSADGQNPQSGTPPDPKDLAALQKARKAKMETLSSIQTKASKGEQLSDDEITQGETLAAELDTLDTQIETLATQATQQQQQQQQQSQQDAAARAQRQAALLSRSEQLSNNGRNNPMFRMQSGAFIGPANEERLEIGRYSLLRAMQRRHHCQALDGIEHEVSREIEKLYHKGNEPEGFYMPLGLPVNIPGMRMPTHMSIEQLMLTEPLDPEYLANDTAGNPGIITAIQAPTMIELLRAKMLLVRLGVTMLTGLNAPFKMPRLDGGHSASWYDEATSTDGESELDIGSVPISPKHLRARSLTTRSLMKQSGNFSLEMTTRNDQALSLALGFDSAAFNGTGSNGQPTGVFTDANVPVVAIGTNGGALTWAKVIEFQTKVAIANADVANMTYVTNPQVVGHCMTTPKVSGQPVFLMGEGGTMAGRNVVTSTSIPANLTKGTSSGTLSGMVFGDWSTLVVAQYGGAIDVIVDPYTKASTGGIYVTSLMEGDVVRRHATALAKCVDILPS